MLIVPYEEPNNLENSEWEDLSNATRSATCPLANCSVHSVLWLLKQASPQYGSKQRGPMHTNTRSMCEKEWKADADSEIGEETGKQTDRQTDRQTDK